MDSELDNWLKWAECRADELDPSRGPLIQNADGIAVTCSARVGWGTVKKRARFCAAILQKEHFFRGIL